MTGNRYSFSPETLNSVVSVLLAPSGLLALSYTLFMYANPSADRRFMPRAGAGGSVCRVGRRCAVARLPERHPWSADHVAHEVQRLCAQIDV